MATYIIDGNNQMHRMLHQANVGQLRTSEGRSTGALYGVTKNVVALLQQDDEARVVFCFDDGVSARRIKLCPEYKLKRRTAKEEALRALAEDARELDDYDEPPPPYTADMASRVEFAQALRENEESLREVLPHLGVQVVSLPGREGDDVVALVARDPKLSDDLVTIVSEDKDLLQLVDDRIQVWRPIKDVVVRPRNFEEVTGFATTQHYLWARAIIGDASDEIVGVHGAGEGTAKAVLEAVGVKADLEDVFDYCAAHKHKRVRKVAEQADVVLRNLQLMDFRCEVWSEDDYKAVALQVLDEQSKDVGAACEVLKRLEAYGLANEVGAFA